MRRNAHLARRVPLIALGRRTAVLRRRHDEVSTVEVVSRCAGVEFNNTHSCAHRQRSPRDQGVEPAARGRLRPQDYRPQLHQRDQRRVCGRASTLPNKRAHASPGRVPLRMCVCGCWPQRWLHTPRLASPGLDLNQDDCRHPSPRQARSWPALAPPAETGDAGTAKALSRQRQSQRVLLYGFEANAHFTPQLEVLERRQRRNGYRVKLFTSTAIATRDGAMRLAIDQSVGHLGSGIEACHAEHASLPATPAASSAAAMVRAVDAARFLASLAAPEYTGLMAAKLDIEGCEFFCRLAPSSRAMCRAPRGRAELLAIECGIHSRRCCQLQRRAGAAPRGATLAPARGAWL